MNTEKKRTPPVIARPFLKWAGGKSQLLTELEKRLPAAIRESRIIDRYIEPFIGGGALFFYLKNHYTIKEAFILDANDELVIAYNIVKNYPKPLLEKLEILQEEYLGKDDEQRKTFYYEIREAFNIQAAEMGNKPAKDQRIQRTAWLIFLNKTCYNGLFRKNRSGGFNVPFGRYKKPTICTRGAILAAHEALKDTEIIRGDFEESRGYVTKESFIYLDPPYRPLNKTSNFTGYSENGFSDEDQERLARYYRDMAGNGAQLLLSNSDPMNQGRGDTFFDTLYTGFRIERVDAVRMINCNAAKRGKISEILVSNYD